MGKLFAQDQAQTFDKKNWRFYTGEWHEDLYPGYSFYVQFRGSLGILYEQSRMAEDGVRRPEGTIQIKQRISSSPVCKYNSKSKDIRK